MDIRVERAENVGKNRNGRARARGGDVRKGKLLAGDSGRKIAEVIDLRGVIYQRGLREEGEGARQTWYAAVLVYVHTDSSRYMDKVGRVKGRARVFVAIREVYRGGWSGNEGDEESGEAEGERRRSSGNLG